MSKETLSGATASKYQQSQALYHPHDARPVDKIRRDRGLPPLRTFVIDVISHTDANLDAEDAEALRKTKMSSTFIREWIVQQRNTAAEPR